MFNKIIGILGGMGPFATLDIYKLLLDCLIIKKENEYPHVIISSNPNIPSRTRAFLYNEKSPVSYLLREANRLRDAGADFLIVACNSAHYFLPEIEEKINIDILKITDVVSEYLESKKFSNVAVVGGEIIVYSDLYAKKLKKNILLTKILPDEMKKLRIIIDAVKHNKLSNDNINDFYCILHALKNRGAEAVIMGCTELPMVIRDKKVDISIIDSNLLLAKAAIEKAWNGSKEEIPFRK